jgi:hypothetical protein
MAKAKKVSLKTPTLSDKQYIYANYNKMGNELISVNTGLTIAQIEDIAMSPDLDHEPNPKEKLKGLRRYGMFKGGVAMTGSQSMLDDKVLQNQPVKDTMKEKFGKDFEFIKIKGREDRES